MNIARTAERNCQSFSFYTLAVGAFPMCWGITVFEDGGFAVYICGIFSSH